MYQGSVNIKLREVFYMYIRGRTRTLFMSKSLKHYTSLCDLWSQIKISSQLFTEEQLISWISYLFPLYKNFSSANKCCRQIQMHVPSKQERHNSMLIWTNWICLCLLGSESFICNNHNSWAKVNGQGDMQTYSRQNVVSSKSIAIVYHSFKLDYIAFFLDDVREFCENLKGPWCILQSKSFNLHWWLYRLEYSRVCLV